MPSLVLVSVNRKNQNERRKLPASYKKKNTESIKSGDYLNSQLLPWKASGWTFHGQRSLNFWDFSKMWSAHLLLCGNTGCQLWWKDIWKQCTNYDVRDIFSNLIMFSENRHCQQFFFCLYKQGLRGETFSPTWPLLKATTWRALIPGNYENWRDN